MEGVGTTSEVEGNEDVLLTVRSEGSKPECVQEDPRQPDLDSSST